MFNSSVTAKGLLVGSRVKETDVLGIPIVQLWQVHCVGVFFGVVVILAVASQTAKEHALVFNIPVIDRQQDELLVNGPGIGQGIHE